MAPLDELATKAHQRANDEGAQILEAFVANSERMVSWLSYVRSYHGGPGSRLIHAYQNANLEAAGYASLGLAAGALAAQRRGIELLHYWLYFSAQPQLWRSARGSGRGFPSRDGTIGYVKKIVPQFKERWSALEANKSRQFKNPYSALSQHLHAQSSGLIRRGANLASLVAPMKTITDVCDFQSEIDEYLSDTLGSWQRLA